MAKNHQSASLAVGIYAIRHLQSGRMYIGSSQNIHYRWKRHRGNLRAGKHPNTYLQHAWSLYGEQSFLFEVLEFVEDSKRLLIVEQQWLDSGVNLYNINPLADCPPSRKGSRLTPEHAAKLKYGASSRVISNEQRIAMGLHFKGKTHTPDARQRLHDAHVGRQWTLEVIERRRQTFLANGKTKGLKRSQETREKLRIAHLGKGTGPRSAEVCRRISEGLRGQKWSEERRAAASISRKGRTASEETKQRQSTAMKAMWMKKKAATAPSL